MLPKITVITPSYNQANFIEQTIQSVVNQGYPNLEYLIMDGGSQDGTTTIIQKYNKEVTFWESVPDHGQSHAINKGLVKATGELVVWLNSDDYYERDSLFKIGVAFEKRRKSVQCILGKIQYFTASQIAYLSDHPLFDDQEKTAGYGKMPQPAMFFSLQSYQTIGFLNEKLRYCMDLEWWLKFLMVYGLDQVVSIPDILVHFRIHATSKTGSQQNGFAQERDSIYYSIASQAGLQTEAQLIKEWGNVSSEYTFSIPVDSTWHQKNYKKMVHYFLLLRGEEFYFANDRLFARACFDSVDPTAFTINDKRHLQKLIFRNTYVPLFLIKWLRRR